MGDLIQMRAEPSRQQLTIFDPDNKPELYPFWDSHGRCVGMDPAIFFPEKQVGPKESKRQVARAKLICDSCPVRVSCLTHALLINAKFGIWGGTTVKERKAMLKSAPHWQKCSNCGELNFGNSGLFCCSANNSHGLSDRQKGEG